MLYFYSYPIILRYKFVTIHKIWSLRFIFLGRVIDEIGYGYVKYSLNDWIRTHPVPLSSLISHWTISGVLASFNYNCHCVLIDICHTCVQQLKTCWSSHVQHEPSTALWVNDFYGRHVTFPETLYFIITFQDFSL